VMFLAREDAQLQHQLDVNHVLLGITTTEVPVRASYVVVAVQQHANLEHKSTVTHVVLVNISQELLVQLVILLVEVHARMLDPVLTLIVMGSWRTFQGT